MLVANEIFPIGRVCQLFYLTMGMREDESFGYGPPLYIYQDKISHLDVLHFIYRANLKLNRNS